MDKLYNIMSQTQTTEINPSGTGFQDVWAITYKVLSGPAKGTVATINVPESEHNSEYVDAAIRDKISTLANVAGLGGGMNA